MPSHENPRGSPWVPNEDPNKVKGASCEDPVSIPSSSNGHPMIIHWRYKENPAGILWMSVESSGKSSEHPPKFRWASNESPTSMPSPLPPGGSHPNEQRHSMGIGDLGLGMGNGGSGVTRWRLWGICFSWINLRFRQNKRVASEVGEARTARTITWSVASEVG